MDGGLTARFPEAVETGLLFGQRVAGVFSDGRFEPRAVDGGSTTGGHNHAP
jgi:hypothetical protein